MDTWTLVMLTEYMDHSLVMLARKMCWSLEDVAYYALKVSHGKKVRTVNCINPRTPDGVCEPPWWEGRSRSSVFSSVCSLSLSLSPLSLSLLSLLVALYFTELMLTCAFTMTVITKAPMSDDLKSKIRKLDWMDNMLYQHFNATLWKQINVRGNVSF